MYNKKCAKNGEFQYSATVPGFIDELDAFIRAEFNLDQYRARELADGVACCQLDYGVFRFRCVEKLDKDFIYYRRVVMRVIHEPNKWLIFWRFDHLYRTRL